VTIIPNGVDLARFSPREAGSNPENGLVVGAMSNLRPEKGLADLIRALGIVRDLGLKGRVVIYGEGPSRGELETLISGLNLDHWVSLPGTTKEPEAALRNLDVFVLPSVSESCSNALMEAMATGLPVIATAIGGNPTLVEADRTGLLVPPGDAAALARAIARLIEDRDLAARLGERARAQAHRLFSMELMVSRTEELYARSLGAA
jgi:glycosyltransferase involved in cell wall biosynthesis